MSMEFWGEKKSNISEIDKEVGPKKGMPVAVFRLSECSTVEFIFHLLPLDF